MRSHPTEGDLPAGQERRSGQPPEWEPREHIRVSRSLAGLILRFRERFAQDDGTEEELAYRCLVLAAGAPSG